jgi:hypothetical protein
MIESIQHEKGDRDAWICLCGNTPADDGFYPIDEQNHEVEPTPKDWTTNEYFCGRCGRIIDQKTLRIVRRLDPATIMRRS